MLKKEQQYNLKALITGATGFIGSHLADELLSRGYSLRCSYRKTSDLRWLKGKDIELIETDLYDMESVKQAIKDVDYIFHSAGAVKAINYNGFLRGNLVPTKNLIDACLQSNIKLKRFVYISSQTVVGPASSPDLPLDENTKYNPITDYGKSKKASEEFVVKHKDNLPITIIRPPGVFGPRDTAIYSLFKIVSLHIAPYFGMTDKYVSLINAYDLARGIAMAAESEKAIGEIYFLAYDEYFSYRELFNHVKNAMAGRKVINLRIPESVILAAGFLTEMIGKITKSPPVFNYDKGIDFIQTYWICKSDKARRDFGFKPNRSMESAIKETVDWYKQQGWIK